MVKKRFKKKGLKEIISIVLYIMNLPLEIINKILVTRPLHPTAILIKKYFRVEFEILLDELLCYKIEWEKYTAMKEKYFLKSYYFSAFFFNYEPITNSNSRMFDEILFNLATRGYYVKTKTRDGLNQTII